MPPRRKPGNGPHVSAAPTQVHEPSAPPLTQTKLPIPRKRIISAPPDRVYKSSIPLTQAKLPIPRKHIRSYGKKTTNRIPKQETLTQMDYLRMSDPVRLDNEDEDPDEIEEADEDYEKQAKKRRSKRRKTTGDEPDSTPSYHTQRLTQMEWSFTSALDDEDDSSIFDVPSSSQTDLPTMSSRRTVGESFKTNAAKAQQSPIKEMPPPQTPRRILTAEIPSSQSPATPFSIPSRGSLRRSPLKETSINTPIPFNTGRRSEVSSDKLPKLEIRDTYDTADTSQFSRVPSSPAKRPSSVKSVRFTLPDQEDEAEEPASPLVTRRSTPGRKSVMKRTEILDSDAESDEDLEDDEIPLGRDIEEEPVEEAKSLKLDNDEDHLEPIDLSGLLELGSGEDMEDQETHTEKSPELGNDEAIGQSPVPESQEEPLEPETFYGDIGLETQMEANRVLGSSERRSMTATQPEENIEEDDDEDDEDIPHETAVEKTQLLESQRLSTQHVHSMEPRTAESDVFVSIPPTHLTNIISGAKNHEFRNWSFALPVRRIWIYETRPTCMLKYMAEIGPAKRPGELTDATGLGNVDFNGKACTWRAYEILQVYQLADPEPLAQLKEKGWLKAPPSKTARVAPAVIDELMANLLPPLFPERVELEAAAPASSSTDTQEVDEQIVSTMKQYSQVPAPSHLPLHQVEPEEVEYEEAEEEGPAEHERNPASPSPQATPQPPRRFNGPPPSQATTVDLSQTQTPMQHSQSEIIWESPARPVTSSTPARLPTPCHGSDLETQGPESHPPFSMASSQILSKTQLLSDSLFQDSVPGPPPFIQDSDDEDD
ncbi:hypothetical protein BKA65DRAFT_585468 [Rhexocercosporidium sp. MPI-PUGE-AT-0058]|nr:hypothetical protein BKA65DRAFT_585468 [Rhexocercosporidium sp. MPI-PUGE-AT-0058]